MPKHAVYREGSRDSNAPHCTPRAPCAIFVQLPYSLSSMTTDEPHPGATVHVDPGRRCALITWAPGVPVFNPWMTTIETLLSHPDFRPDFAVISDWRAAQGGPDQAFVDAFLVFCQSVRRARRLTGRW